MGEEKTGREMLKSKALYKRGESAPLFDKFNVGEPFFPHSEV